MRLYGLSGLQQHIRQHVAHAALLEVARWAWSAPLTVRSRCCWLTDDLR